MKRSDCDQIQDWIVEMLIAFQIKIDLQVGWSLIFFYHGLNFYVLEADFPRSSKHPCPHHVLEESRNLKKENEALKERVSRGVPV